jgi:TRAP-type uncharacterized transport system fused permease subunit
VININTQVRISLSVACLALVAVPLLFADQFGKGVAICLSLGALCLFIAIAVIPFLSSRNDTRLEREYYSLSLIIARKQAEASRAYDSSAKVLIRIGLAFLVIGIVVSVIVY